MSTDPTLTVSAVTEILIRVGGLPDKYTVSADSRRSDPVIVTYRPAYDLPTRDFYLTIADAKVIGKAIMDAAGALEVQFKQMSRD